MNESKDDIADKCVNPSHYAWATLEVQPIDVMNLFGSDLANAIKYIIRAGKKYSSSEVEDLTKARIYLRHCYKTPLAMKPEDEDAIPILRFYAISLHIPILEDAVCCVYDACDLVYKLEELISDRLVMLESLKYKKQLLNEVAKCKHMAYPYPEVGLASAQINRDIKINNDYYLKQFERKVK